MNTIDQIKQDYTQRFLNDESSMNLDPNNMRVDNANDVLYQAVFLNLLDLHGALTQEFIDQAARACDILRKKPGLFYRWTHDKVSSNSHDNYEGLASMQVFSKDKLKIAEEICIYGEQSGWNFETEEEKKFSFKTVWQPGTIGFMKLCNNQRPYILELIALCVGIILGALQWKRHVHHKTWHIVWTLRRQIFRHADKPSWVHVVTALSFVCLVFDLVSIVVFGNRHQAVVNYYTEKNHPNVRLALELIKVENKR